MQIKRKPQGAALAIGLMLILVITMTTIIAMSGSVMQEKMAGAARNESIAEGGADSVLRNGERWIFDYTVSSPVPLLPGATSFVTTPESSNLAGTDIRNFRTSSGWVAAGRPYQGQSSVGSNPISSSDYQSMTRVPAFMIEVLGVAASGSSRFIPGESHGLGGATTGGGGSNSVLRYYRITGRSTGGSDNVVRTAESTFTIVAAD
ncbi:hypothetical protein C7S18_02670 [Ahniella affigens]|uniref:Type 4 fimbrial biogenesis protein PilX N-terminal domain-containing protein n=1 Tax=Ahniella affigens TaxID=2021234 RepID=A0A2P1PMT4_9GAMM|nr:PilX N-terminal domain-containing pilus assembly protein [Ahniella affigens]AVP96163.1 hypothetical protein C7S18_02670 [Ahniella affigens]